MARKKTPITLPWKVTDDPQWTISQDSFDAGRQGHFETIFTLANGRLGVRGSLEYAPHSGIVGSYLAGVYDATPLHYSELVNIPNWLLVEVGCNGIPLDPSQGKILDFRRILDMRQGGLFHLLRWQAPNGEVTRYESARLVHCARRDIGLVLGRVTAENWSGRLTLKSGLDAGVWNTTMFSQVKVQHVTPRRWDVTEKNGIQFEGRTAASDIDIAIAARFSASRKGHWEVEHGNDRKSECFTFQVRKGQSVDFEKLIAFDHSLHTPRPRAAVSKALAAARKTGRKALIDEHVEAWSDRWAASGVTVVGDAAAQVAIRFNLFHLNQLGSPEEVDASIGAKGLHGEGYRGHVFWDAEIYILPFYIYTWPEAARNLLMYRWRRLPAARRNAKLDGWRGAKFPWESADAGCDVTPVLGSDFLTGEGVLPRYIGECQHHVTADVAYGFTHYCLATCDEEFYREVAARVLIETATFWGSRVEWDRERKNYVIRDVMPPDEFHGHVDNSAFTNVIAAWNLTQGLHAVEYLRQQEPARLEALEEELGIGEKDYRFWRRVSSQIYVAFNPESMLYEQHEGYFQLEDVVLKTGLNGRPQVPQEVRGRLSETQVLKQSDVVLLHYLLPERFSRDVKRANYLYYEPRTSHLSSLSPGIHAIMGIEVGEYDKAYRAFLHGARMEIEKTANFPDGIHAANLGNTWQVVVNGFGGLRVVEGELHLRPWLPPKWKSLSFQLLWQGDRLDITVTRTEFRAQLTSSRRRPVLRIFVNDDWADVTPEGVRLKLADTRKLLTPPQEKETAG